MHHENIHPQWVLVEGKYHHVSDFAHLQSAQRPQATCPICQNPIIMKLGEVRAYHYAHYPEDLCAASQPETALHLNTKYYLAEQLRTVQAVYYGTSCIGYCSRTEKRVWISGWERVEVEYLVGNYRLDIALLREDRVIGGIEVLVTHAVEPEKEDFLVSQGIPWVEIEAKPELYEADHTWTPAQLLPIYRQAPRPKPYECIVCKNAREKEEAKSRRRAEYRRNNHTTIRFGRMVDFYYPSGKKWRETLIIEKGKRKGRPFARLRTWGDSDINRKPEYILTITKISPTILEELKEAAAAWISRKEAATSALVEELMDWHDWATKPRPHPGNLDAYPFKYEWTGEIWVETSLTLQNSITSHFQLDGRRSHHSVRASAKHFLPCRRCGTVTNKWPFRSFDKATNTCICAACI